MTQKKKKTIFKFHLNTAMIKTIFFAILKLFICIHCCHTTLLALKYTPLKCLELIKKGLSMMSIIEHLSDFSGDYRAF